MTDRSVEAKHFTKAVAINLGPYDRLMPSDTGATRRQDAVSCELRP